MLENIRLSFQGIWSHKMRSFLTMLGIIIGIASIISIVSTIKGTQEQIKQNLIGSGNNTVKISLQQGDMDYETAYNGLPQGVTDVTEEELEQIADLEEVEQVSAYRVRNYAENIYYRNTALEGGKVLGIGPSYLGTAGYRVQKGRGFLNSDYAKCRKVLLVDDVAAESLFAGEDPIGKTIEIQAETFVVIGVIAQQNVREPVINSMEEYYTYMQDESGSVFIPNTTWPIIYYYDEPSNVVVQATSTETMSAAGKKTADILNTNITASGMGDTDETALQYKAADIQETVRNLQSLSESTNTQLLWIASISLLVGGIGVMNIMLVSVTERTSEIGLKKAIGARKKKILIQFLTEAVVLTSIGGLLGVGCGLVLAQVVSRLSGTPTAISIPAIVGSVLFSMLIGIVFGLLPSIKASNLNPIEALRYE